MATIENGNLKSVISTLKGIAPANYPSMDRLVSCVQFLEAVLDEAEQKKKEEVTGDG